MREARARIYFHDEARRIGCGWRRVTIKMGPAWVRITERSTKRRVRICRRVFDEQLRDHVFWESTSRGLDRSRP
jgi:hypothetical protein